MTPADALTAAVAELREVVRDLRIELATLRDGSPPAIVDADGVAQILGVGERTLRRLRRARGFPRPIRGPGPLRWRASDVQRYLEGGR